MKKIIVLLLILSISLQAQIPKKIESGEKSIPLGIVLSTALPGAGQLYADKPWISALYLGIEAAAITGALYFKAQGKKGIDDYEDFADENWDVENWLNFYDPAIHPTTHHAIVYVDRNAYSPESESEYERMMADINDGYEEVTIWKDYHFYENIGKYEQFKMGWKDWVSGQETPSDPELGIYAKYSDNQYSYASMRRAANKLLQFSTYCGTAIFLNHFISAIDAGFRLKKLNENQDILLTLTAAPIIRSEGVSGIQAGFNMTF
ncbi:MAG: hypothetical protein WCT23_06655 [Candidatus Neomarinimicrobiota bacterium]